MTVDAFGRVGVFRPGSGELGVDFRKLRPLLSCGVLLQQAVANHGENNCAGDCQAGLESFVHHFRGFAAVKGLLSGRSTPTAAPNCLR